MLAAKENVEDSCSKILTVTMFYKTWLAGMSHNIAVIHCVLMRWAPAVRPSKENDIREYDILYPSAKERWFEYLADWDPGALKEYRYDGNLFLHANIIYHELEGFAMALKAGMKYYPEELGFLFQKDRDGYTAYKLACIIHYHTWEIRGVGNHWEMYWRDPRCQDTRKESSDELVSIHARRYWRRGDRRVEPSILSPSSEPWSICSFLVEWIVWIRALRGRNEDEYLDSWQSDVFFYCWPCKLIETEYRLIYYKQ